MINQTKMQEFITYETPQVEVLEVQVEKGFAVSEDPTITNPDMGWG